MCVQPVNKEYTYVFLHCVVSAHLDFKMYVQAQVHVYVL